MKKLRLRPILMAGLLLVGSHMAMAETMEVNVGGINYDLDSKSMTAAVAPTADASGEITLPQSVSYDGKTYALTSIGEEAFAVCKEIISVSIPSGVTFIGKHAFLDCENLASVDVPSSVSAIEEGAFEQCYQLASIDLPSSVKYIGHHAFYMSSLTSVTIPEGVDSIAARAFGECHELASVELPSSLTFIGEEAFYFCESLTSVTIPSSVTFIGEDAFSYCFTLENIVVENGNKVYDSRDNCNAIIETATNKLVKACQTSTIPYGVASIGKEAFGCLLDIPSITIPSSVTSIEDEAFYYCISLTSITIPSSVTSMGKNPFASCSGLQSIVVEDGNSVYDSRNGCNAIIETAVGRLVSGCANTTIPHGVTIIGEKAFSKSSFTSIDIPSSVTTIERLAFYGSGLTSLDIPSSVQSIGEKAFQMNSNLASLTIRSENISIGEEAFYGCSELKDVYCYGSKMIEKCADDSFSSISDDATLHVDASLVDKYKATSPWNTWFANIVALDREAGIENIEANAQGSYRVYSVDGKEPPSMQKGINILRSKSGKRVKVIK